MLKNWSVSHAAFAERAAMERRRHARAILAKEVAARVGRWRCELFVRNLSSHGCSLETPFRLAADQVVMFKFLGQILVSGEIMWQHERTAGVRFVEPLHEAIVAHITHQRRPSAAVMLQDRFGRPVEGRSRRAYPLRIA